MARIKRDKNPLKSFYQAKTTELASTSGVNSENFDLKLSHALNSYNQIYNLKDAKKFLLEFYSKNRELKSIISSMTEKQMFEYKSFGFLCKFLKDSNVSSDITESNQKWIKEKEEEIKQIKVEKEIYKKEKPKHDVQKAILEQVRQKIGEIDYYIESFVYGKKTDFNVIDYIKSCEFSPIHLRKVINIYEKEREEYVNIETDEEVKESYKFLSKVKIKKIIDLYDEMLNSISELIKATSTRRKTRSKKVSVQKIISKVKYLVEDKDIGITSLAPERIIGSFYCYTYNIKTRKLSFFKTKDASGLKIKGTTIIDFDEKESSVKTIRQNVDINTFVNKPKTTTKKSFDTLTTKPTPTVGRINSDTLILNCFK